MAPGDVVFSFSDTCIKATRIGVSHAYEAPKPCEFGQAGAYWENIGCRVDVRFAALRGPIRPVAQLAPQHAHPAFHLDSVFLQSRIRR